MNETAEHAMSKLALWITRHWPFSCYNRLMWPIQLWLIGIGGRAFCEEIYGHFDPAEEGAR